MMKHDDAGSTVNVSHFSMLIRVSARLSCRAGRFDRVVFKRAIADEVALSWRSL